MQCKNCKSSFAQHELTPELTCLKCTAKELANSRVHEAHLDDGLRAAEEELATVKAQHDEALARERQLREALARLVDENPKSDILCDDGFTFSFQKNSRVHKRALEALTTPAPRVFTLEECRPLVSYLKEMVALKHAPHAIFDKFDSAVVRAETVLTHARKLGMEGEQ